MYKYMAAYNHPRSYNGPENNVILTERNVVNAPIHLTSSETKNCRVNTLAYDIADGEWLVM